MIRSYNFSAGPAMLPEEILKEAQAELLDWNGSGRSVMEMGHRSDAVLALMAKAEQQLRELIDIPDNYHVLFLGGAARTHFAMIPMNFLGPEDKAGYLDTGLWSSMAYQEACKLKNAYCVASTQADSYLKLPEQSTYQFQDDGAYIYYTANETVNGIQFSSIPEVGHRPLIADMTSCLLTERIDVRQFALIFAGAQKNISNAGLTVVIVRDDLLSINPKTVLPTMLDYRVHADLHSLYATPPVFNCYLASKMFDWIKGQGGVEALSEINRQKAAKLYAYIDSSDLYHCEIQPESRSLVNICFRLTSKDLEDRFVQGATEQKLYALKGHRLRGGLRASLYNAMPMEGVEQLIQFMQEFSKDLKQ